MSQRLGRILFILLAAMVAMAADAPNVRLSTPATVAFPRIVSPVTVATAKINAALAALDRRWARYVRDCRAGGKGNEASRRVSVTMAGPRFLSVVANDEEDCGGAHPDASTTALVYDLETGRPVDWRRLLGPRLVTAASIDSVIDGTRIGMVSSPELHGLYVKAVKLDKDCADAVADPAQSFIVWLDARRRSVVIEPVLPHVAAACAQEGRIGVAALRRAGAAPELVAALGG